MAAGANPFFDQTVSSQPKGFRIINWLQFLAVLMLLLMITYLFVLTPNQVDGYSMYPTLDNDEVLLTNRLIQHLGKSIRQDYTRGDVIVIKPPGLRKEPGSTSTEPEEVVKRIIALPGERIMIQNGRVFINSREVISESYLTPPTLITANADLATSGKEITVPENAYFVMGDNRGGSTDSRYSVIGPVDRAHIIGKVVLRIWPLSKFSGMENGKVLFRD